MHQITDTLVVDAHNPADIVVFAVLKIIKVDDLALAGRELFKILLHGVSKGLLTLHTLMEIFVVLGYDLHIGIGNFAVAELEVPAILVVDTVAKGDVEIALNIVDGS